jgi:hypothetical protein
LDPGGASSASGSSQHLSGLRGYILTAPVADPHVRRRFRGATEYQMMALFDWDSSAQAATYIKEANGKRITMTSAHMLETPRVH